MNERTITVNLTEDQYNCVQAQLENPCLSSDSKRASRIQVRTDVEGRVLCRVSSEPPAFIESEA